MADARPGLATLADVVLAALGAALPEDVAAELAVLLARSELLGSAPAADLHHAWLRVCAAPEREDRQLLRLSATLELTCVETLAVALALAVERDVLVGRALSTLQHPLGGSRPTLGLLASALSWSVEPSESVVDALLSGAAYRTGLITLTPHDAPIPERVVLLPQHLIWALNGLPAAMDGATLGPMANAPRLALSLIAEAGRHAQALMHRPGSALAIRSGSVSERRAVAAAVCIAIGKRPVYLSRPQYVGMTPWLLLDDLVPVFECELGPSERFEVPELAGYLGPRIVTAGPDGGIVAPDGAPYAWRVPVPPPAERCELWASQLGDVTLANQLGQAHRHGCGRIAELARLARQRAALDGRDAIGAEDMVEAAWSSDASGLEALAEPVRARIPTESLVLNPRTQRELELLQLRCQRRENLCEGLGVSAATRYRPGVRALFVGPSGSGKTLAVSWLASRLGMPLYRVDVASVTSKYIGETEKNLAQLLARAEDAEVALLFDEADSLFGKRTEVKHSNDRFANAQTNYLLQRIESYDGIVMLTSNNRSRFDSAFTRRLDFIVDFPAPGVEQRRKLWEVHLGEQHDVDAAQLNRLAATLDLVGGHIRNAVLSAAVLAGAEGRRIAWPDVLRGVDSELRKLGQQLPPGLSDENGRVTRNHAFAPRG